MPTLTYYPGILGPVVDPLTAPGGTGGGGGGIQTLTPAQDVADGTGLNLTALLASPGATTLQFANTGKERLYIAAGASSEVVTVEIGTVILGQPVNPFPSVVMLSGDLYQFGPFRQVVDESGTNIVQVYLSTAASITVALLQGIGVY